MSKTKSAPPVRTKTGSTRRLKPIKRVWSKPGTWFVKNITRSGGLPKVRFLLRQSLVRIWNVKKPVFGVYLVSVAAPLLLANVVINATNLNTLHASFQNLQSGFSARMQSTSVELAYVLSGQSSNSTDSSSSLYRILIVTVCSLAFIWLLRQSVAGSKVTAKLSFYKGMYPLIPLLTVFLIIGVQLIPFALGSFLYSSIVTTGIATSFLEGFVALLIFILLSLWSLRMVTSSIFAIYIVTLPGMEPLKSLKEAKHLVAERRLLVWRKLLPLPILVVLAAALVLLPFIFISREITVWMFYFLSGAWFIFVHSYLYTVYRELIENE